MDFGIMFFSSSGEADGSDIYFLVKEAAKFADRNQFCSVWIPERHFHEFGSPFPNPSVLGAALAMITEQIQVRAGSLISPLHDAVRIVEDWSVVDNLSGGRIAISFGSGWNVDDFIFFPERYKQRQAVMFEQIALIKELWRGKQIARINGAGKEVPVRTLPHPLQADLPVWVTSSGNIETFISAGCHGANLLTHLLGQDIPALAEKIAAYRKAREEHGYDPSTGIVSLMLHTYVGNDLEQIKAEVRLPFREYLRSAVALEKKSAKGGGVISGGRTIEAEEICSKDMEDLLDLAFERYYNSAALIGTPESCTSLVKTLEEIGVNEIACLIDFGVAQASVLENLQYLKELREQCSSAAQASELEAALQEFTADF
jgi:natural product biosynthesis luciferase-like monooxygenase protein